MSVGKLLDEMTYEELQGWFNYFERRPIGWRDDDRTYKLLQAQGVKEKPQNLFTSLKAVYDETRNINSEGTDIGSLKGSLIFQKMLTARGGDLLDL